MPTNTLPGGAIYGETQYSALLEAINKRELEFIQQHFHPYCLFLIGSGLFELDKIVALIEDSEHILLLHFNIMSSRCTDSTLNVDLSCNIIILQDCKLLYVGETKAGEYWQVNQQHTLTLREGLIERADIKINSILKLK